MSIYTENNIMKIFFNDNFYDTDTTTQNNLLYVDLIEINSFFLEVDIFLELFSKEDLFIF